MSVEIGSKYEENKSLLERKIREGTVKVIIEKSSGNCCYFCCKPINGEMLTIEDIENIGGKEMLLFYASDKDCYSRIIGLSNEKRMVYSLN